jgi:hypothetical protein
MPYIGRSTDGFGVRNRFIYLASSGDTSVSGADANGATLTFTDGAYVDVYLNGVLLKPTTDYNTSTANTIAGLSALNTNDEVTVVVYDVFTVADMVSATSGGTFVGNVNFSGNIDVDGTANLDAVDIDGNVDIAGTTALKEDVVFHGDNYNVMWDKSASDLSFDDNAKLTFGAGNDLQIYHTPGTGTFIDEADDGSLFIRSSRVTIHKYTGETMINAVADGAVSLYYNDNKVCETDTYGIIVSRTTASAVLELASNTSSGSGSPQFIMKQSGTRYGFLEAGVNSAGNGYGNHLLIRAEQGDVYVRDSGGNSTQVSPHNFAYIPDGASETGAWCYKSDKFETEVIEKDGDDNPTKEKVKSGTFISADMTKVIRQVEKLTGEKLIHKGTLDVDENGEVSKHNDDGSKVTENIIAGLMEKIETLEAKVKALEEA